jgi:hypothetical protein
MKMEEKNEPIMFEDALSNPTYAHLHDVLRYVDAAHDSELSPKKYQMGLEHITIKHVQLTFNEQPNLGLKDVVISVLEKLPSDIPPSFMLKIMHFIIKKWENLSNHASEKGKMKMVA